MSNQLDPAKKRGFGKIYCLALAALWVCAASLTAQSVIAVPVPSQLATAQTAFLANGGTTLAFGDASTAQIIYAGLYKALTVGGQYRLVSAPADAELSMVVATQNIITNVSSGSSFNSYFIRLEIYDTKTHALLWTLRQSILPARGKSFQKNADKTVNALMADLKTLASGSFPGNPATASKPTTSKPTAPKPAPNKPGPTKTRLSNEGKN